MRLPDDAAQDFAMRLRRQGGAQSPSGFAPGEQNPYGGGHSGFNPWGGGFRGGGGFGGWGRQNQGPMPFPQGPQRPQGPVGMYGGWNRQNQGPLPPQINMQRPMGGFGGGPYDPNAKPGVITGAQPIQYNDMRNRHRFAPGEPSPYGGGGFPQPEGGPYGPPRPPFDENPQDPPLAGGRFGLGGGFGGWGRQNPGPMPMPPGPQRWDGGIEGGPFGPPKPDGDGTPQDSFAPYVPRPLYGSSMIDNPQIPTENPIFPVNGPELGLPYKGYLR